MINNLNDPSIQNYLYCSIKRHDIINQLIKQSNYNRYLEIGVFDGLNIQKIIAAHKDGVDPGYEGVIPPEVNYPMTSDQFFARLNKDIKYDIIFIDGLHHANQVVIDIKNALEHLNVEGVIILHDCNPPNEQIQKIPRETVAWTGDVWKAFVSFRLNNPQVNSFTIDTDWGVGVIKFTSDILNFNINNISWNDFDQHRQEYLNLISVKDFYENHTVS
jgi:hypothetical protein